MDHNLQETVGVPIVDLCVDIAQGDVFRGQCSYATIFLSASLELIPQFAISNLLQV